MKGTMTLIDALNKLGVPFAYDSNSDSANFIRRFDTNIRLDEPVFLQYVPSLMALWQDVGIQKVYSRRREFHLVCIIHRLHFLGLMYFQC